MTEEKRVPVEIMKRFHDEISRIVAGSDDFATVSDYVNFVLREMLSEDDGGGYTEEEEKEIKKRLDDLGYL